MKKILALVAAMTALFLVSGYAEGLTGTQIPIQPMETPMDNVISNEANDLLDGETSDGGANTSTFGTLELDTTSANLDYSQRLTLTATTFLGGESVRWSSSNASVATISASSGKSIDVVAVNAGTSTITCSVGNV